MRYALISDIHANLPALDAVLHDIARRGDIDAVHHLGDLVGYAPWPNEVVHRIAEQQIAGVSGNYDSTVAHDYKHCGCRSENPRQEELAHESFEWTRRAVSGDSKRLLAALPFRLDLKPSGGHAAGPTVTLVHATPVNNLVYVTEDRPDAFLARLALQAGASGRDVLCFGHTHKPWHRVVDGVHFINTGSVGRPKDGDWRAGYVVLDAGGGAVNVEFVRVEYDVDAAARGIVDAGLPVDFADFLRSGGAVAAR
jgi:predicted phosphodiesterase